MKRLRRMGNMAPTGFVGGLAVWILLRLRAPHEVSFEAFGFGLLTALVTAFLLSFTGLAD